MKTPFTKVFTFYVKSRKTFYVLRKISVALLLLPFFLAAPVLAASPFAVSAARDTFEQQPALRVTFDFPAHHYLYARFTVATPDGTPLAPLLIPPPDTRDPTSNEPSYTLPFTAIYAAPATDTITIHYQGCTDSICFMPEEITLTIALAPDENPRALAEKNTAPKTTPLATRAAPRRLVGYTDVPTFLTFLDPEAPPPVAPSAWARFLEDPAQYTRQRGFIATLILIFLGGLLLNFTPCVLPMIPINLAIIGAGGTTNTRAIRFGRGLTYGLGMALAYGALGIGVILTGSVFGAINSSPLFNGAIAILFFAMGLAMFDIWQLDFSRFRTPRALTNRARLSAIFLMGGISALLAGACVAPVLIAVLALSSTHYAQGNIAALFLPFLLGLGMALPWPLAAAGLTLLPKPGAWMNKLKKALGLLILALAIYYAHNTITVLRATVTEYKTPPPGFQVFDFNGAAAGDFEALLQTAATTGKPILLDFGAHWCKACHLMNVTTLRDPAITEKLRDTIAIQVIADTPQHPPAREALAPFDIQGFPTFLLFPAR